MSKNQNKPADLEVKAADVVVAPAPDAPIAAPATPEQTETKLAVYATENVQSVDLKKEIEGKEVHLHQISIVLPEAKGGDKLTRRDVYIASALKGALTSQFDPTARNADVVADAVVKYADAVIAKLDQ